MKIFKIEIHELLSRIVDIEARSKDEALEKARILYRNQEIVLDYNDFICEKIEVLG